MLFVIALAVAAAFVVSVGAALLISTTRAASLDRRSTLDLVLPRR